MLTIFNYSATNYSSSIYTAMNTALKNLIDSLVAATIPGLTLGDYAAPEPSSISFSSSGYYINFSLADGRSLKLEFGGSSSSKYINYDLTITNTSGGSDVIFSDELLTLYTSPIYTMTLNFKITRRYSEGYYDIISFYDEYMADECPVGKVYLNEKATDAPDYLCFHSNDDTLYTPDGTVYTLRNQSVSITGEDADNTYVVEDALVYLSSTYTAKIINSLAIYGISTSRIATYLVDGAEYYLIPSKVLIKKETEES
jgi:hypothetical protein